MGESSASSRAMAHEASPDFKTWTMRLRPGLKFHDGEPVLSRDAAASLKRWAARDVYGQVLGAFVEEFTTADDRTIRIRFKRRFPRLLEALGRTSGLPAFIMPARFGDIDAFTAIKDVSFEVACHSDEGVVRPQDEPGAERLSNGGRFAPSRGNGIVQ